MTNVLTIFNSEKFGEIRTIEIDNEIWFVGKDVAEALGYADTAHAILDHVQEDDRINSKTHGQNALELGQRGGWLINESGLYSLILSSKLESAKEFKHWVTSEVLPSIRKNGYYVNSQQSSKSEKELEIIKMQTELERAKYLSNIASRYNGKSETFAQILDAHAVKEITGEFILPLPEATEKTYSATEIGKILGISAQKVGALANKLNIKNSKYGKFFVDKSQYSNKEVETFRYFESAINILKEAVVA